MLASLASRPLAAFPVSVAGRLPHHSFRGLLSVHFALRPAWSLSRPRRPLVIGVLQPMALPPSSAPTATGWSDSCRAGFAPAEEWCLFTAHTERPLSDSAADPADQLAGGFLAGKKAKAGELLDFDQGAPELLGCNTAAPHGSVPRVVGDVPDRPEIHLLEHVPPDTCSSMSARSWKCSMSPLLRPLSSGGCSTSRRLSRPSPPA